MYRTAFEFVLQGGVRKTGRVCTINNAQGMVLLLYYYYRVSTSFCAGTSIPFEWSGRQVSPSSF